MLYCSFCGKRIYEESTFCSNCGQKVIRVVEQDEKAPGVPEINQEEAKSENVTRVIEGTERVPDATQTEPIENERNIETQGQVSSAHPKKVIPAICSKEKEITKYVIEIDGKRIDIVANLGKKHKLELFVEGEPPELITEQDTVVAFEFDGLSSRHTLEIWYCIASSSMLNVRYKETGIGIRIDGVPIKGSLADPLLGIKGGVSGLLVFAFALGAKAIFSAIQSVNESASIYGFLVYLVLVIAMIAFALLLKTRPKMALYGGLVIGLLETVEFIIGSGLSIKYAAANYSSGSSSAAPVFMFLFWSSVRIWV